MNPPVDAHRHVLLALGERAGLPFEPLHGEPLYDHALRALVNLEESVIVGVDASDFLRVRDDVQRWGVPATVVVDDDWWDVVKDAPKAGLLIHDPLCPLVTREFLTSMLQRADERPRTSLVAVRPVTDTLKSVVDGTIVGTVDRERLAAITSPIIVPAEVLVRDTAPPPINDFTALVGWLRTRGDVELVRAPSLARRVRHARAVHLLECVDEVARRVRF